MDAIEVQSSGSLQTEFGRNIRDAPNSPYQRLGISGYAGEDNATPELEAAERVGGQE